MSAGDPGAERDEELKRSLSEINERLAAIRGDFATIAATSAVNGLSTKIAELKPRIEGVERAVAGLPDALASIKSQVLEVKGAAIDVKNASDAAKTISEAAKAASDAGKTASDAAKTASELAKTASEDAKVASQDAKTALQAAGQQIPKSVRWWIFGALFAFGIVLGILTVLSTATGISTTLIGLLAALIGGSLLTWYQPTQLPQDKLIAMAVGVLGLSGGCLVGGGFGFLLKLNDPLVDVSGQQKTEAVMRLRDAAAAAADVSRSKLLESVYSRAESVIAADPAESEPTLKRVSGLLQTVSSLRTSESAATSASTKENNTGAMRIYVLNAAQRSELQQAADDIDHSLDNFKIGEKEKEQLNAIKIESHKLLQIISKLPKEAK